MSYILKKISLVTFSSMVLAGCGASYDISDFKKGDVVAWRVTEDSSSKPSIEMDCSKAFASQSGLISVYHNTDGKQVVTLLWGGATSQQKKDQSPFQIFESSGTKIPANINSSDLKENKLVQIVTQPTGSVQRYEFVENKKEKNKLLLESETLVNPSEQEARVYEALKKVGAYDPRTLSYCTTSSFKKYISSMEKSSKAETDIKVDSALEYILDKKWSIESTNCNLNGGAYQMYSRSFPSGYALYAGGKPQIQDAPQEYDFIENGTNAFTYTSKVGANNYIKRQFRIGNILTSEVKTEVQLVNSKKIEYKMVSRSLDYSALMNGRVAYKDEAKTGYGYLCE